MAELHEDRRRALSFGAIADDYDRLRPRYSDVTLDAIATGGTALDVGAGTGILARQLRDRGLDVLAVEPDGAMAAVARESGVPAEVATFEEWDARGRTFDLVTFGQSWHWVDAETAVPRLAGLLNPGGRVVLLWNKLRPTAPSNDDLRAASEDYVNVEAAGAGTAHDQMFAMAELRGRFEAAGFTVTEREDSWTETQEKDRWLDLVFTYSGHSTLPDDRRVALRAALAEVIGDGDVELAAGTIALIAER
ncbi:class I SAM-dependent methyltransferase [Tsukamurella sp. M9C]|uniref:class I SAM-dependent methyltransferase n=1 Tax=unclassified Tsukamurella TaxID=2633480 RepID=UPI001CC8F725|nr:class I SAM-dependent methyltransferase [Tsukamurella sp. M9C]MCA0158543.1 class I SAM-dependent methyltransferase [Tsukamurella sp. M9C]